MKQQVKSFHFHLFSFFFACALSLSVLPCSVCIAQQIFANEAKSKPLDSFYFILFASLHLLNTIDECERKERIEQNKT